ncbi:LIM domain only protein 7 isoform X1 [Colias croceus]|uniref:LIM domain only protein 7 isoform X1 n=1 Tax=Colias crocea TaxID=72248 RepID=UPI001E27D710|nr:LIM domain only protein 7 isoform X1 [Colias croceus]XP_045503992.1 LIM domain only protein 7 isoform X1 [Colias croceus]XP_045503993.1 LIM domain only protein 7 isoform X1 [Colias croceus]
MPSDSGSAWSPPASTERRLSNSSDGSAGSGYSKATSDSADFLTTRPHTAAVLPGKPAANPLQFVRVGPADLGSKAREQLRRAELAKRTEPARIERQEDWQSNLDNWKSSRRKRVEHIIERCVEVKRLGDETNQPRGKSKTFNEMLEERAGRRRRNPLALYPEDDAHDLSDLGIGTSSTKSSLSEDCDTHSLASDGMDLDKNHSDMDNMSNYDSNRKMGSSANEYDTCTTTTISSPEPEEYTYEGAIEGYKSRIISTTNSNIVKTVVNNSMEKSPDKSNGDIHKIRTSVSNKIEEKLSSFQQQRANDLKNNNPKKDLPKVDIHKRREQFERENSQELQINKTKLPDIANKKSIKERLYSLEKFTEESHIQKSASDLTKLPTEVKPLKERLSCLEKVKTTEPEKVKRLSNGDLSNTKSLKERLSSLKSQNAEEEVKVTKTEVKEVSMSLKERLSCLDAAKNKEIPRILVEEEINNTLNAANVPEDNIKNKVSDSSLKTNLSGLESQMQSFCRSLDSLDRNDQASPSSFERVQSLEDFDCVEMQNNTIPSDIETEDSGIHTARDSCAPADDIADLTQVASPIGEPMVEVSEYESSNEDGLTLEPKVEEPAENTTEFECNKDLFIDEVCDQDNKTEDTDSASNYTQALSHPEELSVTEDVTEIQVDKEDEDTLKSLDNQDSSVSLNEPVSNASDGDAVVFEGKMTIQLNLNELCNNLNSGAGTNSSESNANDTNSNNSTNKSMPMVIDALELAFKELDSEESVEITMNDDGKLDESKTEAAKDDFEFNNKVSVTPLYENIDIFGQNNVVGEIDAGAFPLDLPTNVLEPPKEKPPPPPAEDSPEDELLGNGNFKHTNSARRIKKEIRNKRTSFLGIEGQDDSYLDVDLTLAPRPDITSFLQEETKIEKLLYKKTLSHDMDAKLRDSRDSGVDIDRGPSAEAWYKGSSPETSAPHSRQNSEPYTQITVTSDEEESTRNKEQTFAKDLSNKLSDLPNVDPKIDHLDKKLQQQQTARINDDWPDGHFDDAHTKEVLRFERELLQLEQEELRRQKENLLRDQHRIIQKSIQDISVASTPEKVQRSKGIQNYRHSMPNLLLAEHSPLHKPPPPLLEKPIIDESLKRKPFVSEEHIESHFGVEESRKVLYDDKKYERRHVPNVRPAQPVLPPKPKSRESIEREITMRSSRTPSAVEYANIDRNGVQLRQKPMNNANGQYHPMTRHTLQALSAAPTPKLMSNSEWLQTRNPPRQKPANYNYNQHWLVQEAEHRRIEEQKNKMRARHSYHEPALPASPVHAPFKNSPHPVQERRVRPEPRDRSDSREDKLLSVSGRRKCSHCGEELGRGAAMIIESLSLCYHVWCFTCAVCGGALGDGRAGADVRVRDRRLHCQHCYCTADGDQCSRV